jgi:predicted enzyme related to lactoylglutathione lyase
MMMFKEVNAFSSFSVNGIPEAEEFYGRLLELEISHTMGQIVLHIAGGGTVFVYAKPNHIPATYTVLNFPVENLEEAMDELSRRGVQFIIYNEEDFKTDEKGVFQGDGPKIAWFKDPSGNILSVLEKE